MTIYPERIYPDFTVSDKRPAIVIDLLEFDGTPMDITGITAVNGVLTRPDATTVARPWNILTDNPARIEWQWQTGDFTIAGDYYLSRRIEWSPGVHQTMPGEFKLEVAA